MSKTRVLFLGLAVGAAVLAGFLAKGMVKPAPVAKLPATAAPAPRVKLGEILVVKKDVALGDVITRDKIGWQEWPQDGVRKTMITKSKMPDARKKFIGSRARVQLFEGDPVNDKKLVQAGERGFMAAILPKGRRAISVRISAATGAGGFILPNDRVDVLVTRKQTFEGSGDAQTISELVIGNVKVLAVDQTLSQNKEGEQVVVGKTATLELTPSQAEVLAKVETSGQLTLTLRSFADAGSKELGDDGPKLAPQYAKGATGNEIKVFRYGVKSLSAASK
jgi:pilus assembly protein CpaB